MSTNILGIDLGSKTSGTTAICYLRDKLQIGLCPEQMNADQYLLNCIEETEPDEIWIDAPLSLPAAYYGNGDDFFYRKCDRKLGGMSPMFLGALTARAIKLATHWRTQDIEVNEVYPAHIGKKIEASKYRGSEHDLVAFNELLSIRLTRSVKCSNWHEIDAVLAWWTGHLNKETSIQWIGDEEEGRIATIPEEYLLINE